MKAGSNPGFLKGNPVLFYRVPSQLVSEKQEYIVPVRNIGTPTIDKHACIIDRGRDGWMASPTQQT